MIFLLTAILFTVSFAACSLLFKQSSRGTDAVLTRVLESSRPKDSAPGGRSWSAILEAAGSFWKSTGNDKLRAEFLRAGIRSPHAETFFRGSRVLSALIGSAVAGGIFMGRALEFSNGIMLVLGGLVAGSLLPVQILQFRIRRRVTRIQKALPNTLDLLTICAEAGLGLDQAIVQVARELGATYPDIGEELSVVNLEMRAGKSRADALRSFAARTGILDIKKLSAVLIQADRFGTGIAQSLRGHADHLRIQARQTAEEKAAKLGVKMVFPIFFFILPSLFVITVGPVIVRILSDLLPLLDSL